jgi:hypothetical protein
MAWRKFRQKPPLDQHGTDERRAYRAPYAGMPGLAVRLGFIGFLQPAALRKAQTDLMPCNLWARLHTTV